ncbi:MAG: hypothetical protein M0R46_07655 [Candidatus Muirbacterium halophilum]|nr:hypothetical protein [Candidatus Muirbacterium halophilum]MCK9475776.1 hypothetical protein [Candidatus Muirbacterium halophilum]
MYVNIGWEEYLRLKNIIGIFKKSNTELFLQEKGKRIRFDKEIKTIILTDKGLLRIPIRTETVAKRINRVNGGKNGE